MKRFCFTAFFLAVFLTIACSISCKSYPPSFKVSEFYLNNDTSVEFSECNHLISIKPKNFSDSELNKGLIFYPGGRVEYQAYLPLLTKCAQKGFCCVLVKMPFDYAIFDIGAAGKVLKDHPEIEQWYIAGHSLGGAMAASYASRHTDKFKGLILLAAYSTHDISASGLKVLSIYGSKDGVLKLDHYEKYKKNLPELNNGLKEIIIEGGNHAQFASYGAQKDDFMAEIKSDEQQSITAAAIAEMAGL